VGTVAQRVERTPRQMPRQRGSLRLGRKTVAANAAPLAANAAPPRSPAHAPPSHAPSPAHAQPQATPLPLSDTRPVTTGTPVITGTTGKSPTQPVTPGVTHEYRLRPLLQNTSTGAPGLGLGKSPPPVPRWRQGQSESQSPRIRQLSPGPPRRQPARQPTRQQTRPYGRCFVRKPGSMGKTHAQVSEEDWEEVWPTEGDWTVLAQSTRRMDCPPQPGEQVWGKFLGCDGGHSWYMAVVA